MKKILITALVLLMSFSFLSAAATANLDLSTVVGETSVIKITENAIESVADYDDNKEPVVSAKAFDINNLSYDLFVNFKSNVNQALNISVKAPALAHSGGASVDEIGYTITLATNGGGSAGAGNPINAYLAGAGPSDPLPSLVEFPAATGLSVKSHKFTVAIDNTKYPNAIAGTYSATVVFNVQSL